MSVIRESSNFTINHSVLTNIQGNATVIRFGDGTLTRSEVEDFIKDVIALPVISNKIEKHSLIQLITSLPRAEGAYKDYQSEQKNGLCLKGTRETLLGDLGSWLVDPKKCQIYVLSGLAGIGKSTIAYTFASRADALGILGASFFFSRDEFDRKTAKKLFTTIAFQLCVYDKSFAQAIGDALLNEHGSAAITMGLNEQLEALILEPLRDVVKSRVQPTVIVIDALDECADRDASIVLASLERLVHNFPCFKVLLTTRPQPHLDHRLSSHDIFYLQNIEDKIINNDIRLYLKFSLSSDNVAKCLPGLISEWNATDEEIEFLVTAAGKLFIIASTVVRLILDTTVYNPASQMELLMADGQVRFNDLESFYIVILRRALPEKCSSKIVERFTTVIGAILFVQEPLPVTALQHLTFPYTVHDIDGLLKNLKSVITDEHNIPHIYHKSFSDFLIEMCHKHFDTRVIPEDQHRNLATCCFRILNKDLKRNIIDLTGPARFMDNTTGLERQGISDDEFRRKLSLELDYACRYWSIHLEGAGIANFDCGLQELVDELSIFANEHLLHWIEAMSWICKLDLACRALRDVHALLNSRSTSTEMQELFSDALRFISKFYSFIQRSALHTYHSALSFTPTETLLHKRYHKEMIHNICQVQGVPRNWDNDIAYLNHGERGGLRVVFSQDGSMFASLSRRYTKFWDTVTGVPIGTIVADVSAITDDFSTAASHNDCTITLYDVSSCTSIATLNIAPASVVELAISPDSRRLAAGLSDGTVCLWNWRDVDSVARLDQFAWGYCCLTFNSSGDRLAFGTNGGIVLQNGISGEFIANMKPPGKSKRYPNCVAFSRNGSCLAYRDECQLSVWDGKNGTLLGITELKKPGHAIAISDDGTLIAVDQGESIMLWSLNGSDCLKVVESLKRISFPISSITFQLDGLLVMYGNIRGASRIGAIYDVKNRSFTLRPGFHPFAISPDRTRGIIGSLCNKLLLLVLPKALLQPIKGREGRKARAPPSLIVRLSFSPDCLRLASCRYGTIELWDTSCSSQLITTLKASSADAGSCAFSADGSHLATGSSDGIVKLWDGRNGARFGTGILKPKYPMITHMVFLRGILAVQSQTISFKSDITLWDIKTLHPIVTVTNDSWKLLELFRHDTMLVYYTTSSQFSNVDLTVWDVENRKPFATISMNLEAFVDSIELLVMSPDKSKLVIQLDDGNLKISTYSMAARKSCSAPDAKTWIGIGFPRSGHGTGSLSGAIALKIATIWFLDIPLRMVSQYQCSGLKVRFRLTWLADLPCSPLYMMIP